jgi:hypothetical protein
MWMFRAAHFTRRMEILLPSGSMEVLAHFAAGEDVTALNLIRLQWGYMLSNPYGTGGTFWEGYLQDGEFDGGNYTSLAHGWATGPTSGLTDYVAGIGPELSSTVPFHVIPHPGDLTGASATVPLPQGTVSIHWTQNGGSFVETITAPSGVAGRYGVPTGGQPVTISIDGQMLWNGCRAGDPVVPGMNAGTVALDGNYVYLSSLAGSHTVTAATGCSAASASVVPLDMRCRTLGQET